MTDTTKTNATREVRRRRLSVPGTTVHLEPVAAGEGRPLREPRPLEAPYDGPSSQDSPSQDNSFQDDSPQDTSRRGSPQTELFSEPGEDQPPSGRLMAGEVPSGTGLAYRYHRQQGLFAELRALERGEKASEDQNRRDKISRDKGLSARLTPVQAQLLSEAVACSNYENRSAYLQAAATGRDRRAPVLAKGGLLFFWTWAHLGETVGPEAQEQLKRLSQFLLGTEEVGDALALIRRHLCAARLAGSDRLEGERLNGEEGLPPAPESVRRQMPSRPSRSASVRVCRERKKLIRENAEYSVYADMSKFVRHMAFGWDRNAKIRAQCATIAEWMEDCRKDDCREKGGLDGQVGPEEWRRLDDAMHRQFGIFLLGPSATGPADVDGALRRGTRHLLGAAPETFASRVPAAL